MQLTTDRLLLRVIEEKDAAFIFQLYNSPDFITYIGNRHLTDLEKTKRFIKDGPKAMQQEYGHSLWLVLEREKHQPVGVCGLLKRDYLNYPDLGFACDPLYYRQGFMYEASSVVLQWAGNALNTPICGITQSDNRASIKLLCKLGFKFVSTIDDPVSHEPLDYYEFDRRN